MKKSIALIIILILVSMCAWLIFSGFILSVMWPESVSQNVLYCALAEDERSNTYYISSNDSDFMLSQVDDSGTVLMNEKIDAFSVGETWIDGMFVAENKYIVVSVSRVDPKNERITEKSLHLFYENGAYAGELLHEKCDQDVFRIGNSDIVISEISETDTDIVFGVFKDSRIKTYSLEKGGDTVETTLVRDIEMTEGAFPKTFIVLSSHKIAGFLTDKKMFEIAPESQNVKSFDANGVIPDKMFSGSGAVLCHDAVSGGLFLYSLDDHSMTEYLGGSNELDSSFGYSFSKMQMLQINANGRLCGIIYTENGSAVLYCGTQLYMNRINLSDDTADFWSYIYVAAIVIGVVLISILIWDAFCRLLKMRISIMLRQTLFIVAGVVALVYLMAVLLITPSMSALLSEQYESRMIAAADALISTVEDMPDEEAAQVIEKASSKNSEGTSNIHFDFFKTENEKSSLIASSDHFLAGTDSDFLPMRTPLSERLKLASEAGRVSFELAEQLGDRSYVLISLSGDRVLVVSSGTALISERIDEIISAIIRFLVIGGSALILVLLLIEFITVIRIRKLKKGVDAVSGGDYNVTMSIRSGDEVEDLSSSFNTMTRLIKSNMQRMNRINASYYRFVPESMIRLLGASSVEQLDRGACVKKHMNIMVTRFYIKESENANTEKLFDNINSVMQELTSAISENNGTVYDMQADGFNAVFVDSAESPVRAALKVRANAETFNAQRRAAGVSEVGVHIVLTSGDVMLGVVGDKVRLSPTAISSAIVSAELIIQLCRPSNIFICCTSDIMREISGYRNRYIGLFETNEGMVRLYDLFDGDPQSILKHKQMCEERFIEAVSAFYARDFAKAKALFMSIIKISLNDTTSVNYMYFSDKYMHDAPDSLSYNAMPQAR